MIKLSIEGEYLTETWESIIKRIWTDGRKASPRGMETKEIMHVDVHFDDVLDYVFLNPARKANPVMHIVEAMYFLNGRDDDVLATKWLRGMENYLNPETRLFDGGYGPSIARALPNVFHELQRDSETRRAVIPILDSRHVSSMSYTKDYPCNNLLGFNLRDNCLNCWVVTRSQDMFQGYVYDQLEFRMIQSMMASALQKRVGAFDHHIVSCHLYARDFEKALASLDKFGTNHTQPIWPFSDVPGFWKYVRNFNKYVDDPDGEKDAHYIDDRVRAVCSYAQRKRLEFPVGFGGPYCDWLDEWIRLSSLRAPTSGESV